MLFPPEVPSAWTASLPPMNLSVIQVQLDTQPFLTTLPSWVFSCGQSSHRMDLNEKGAEYSPEFCSVYNLRFTHGCDREQDNGPRQGVRPWKQASKCIKLDHGVEREVSV